MRFCIVRETRKSPAVEILDVGRALATGLASAAEQVSGSRGDLEGTPSASNGPRVASHSSPSPTL